MDTLIAYVLAYGAPLAYFAGGLLAVVATRALYEHALVVQAQRRARRRSQRRRGFVL